MRCGEVLALTPDDILDDASISVNKNYEVVSGTEYILTPKTEKGNRVVTIPRSLYEKLEEFIAGMLLEHDERIFYFGHGGLSGEFKRVTEKAGLPPIRLHDIRHSHVSMLVDMGFSIKEIADRIGHESPETTWRIYSHLYPGKDRELADELDKVRVRKKPNQAPDTGF
ncbi:MAG: site-specific integrase [Lachnospiraceae bacterium]|nr:site-specific integrase [Lachnospiraceae bacterium]